MVLVVLIGFPASAQARLLNLGGSVQFSYSRAATFSCSGDEIRGILWCESKDSETEITTFGQRYSLGAFGDLLRVGSYRADISWFDEELDSRSETFKTINEQERELNILDYRLSLNLLPAISPLSLTAQRIQRKNEIGITTKETVNIFGANWLLNLPRLPRLVMSYQRSALDSHVGDAPGSEFVTQAASLQADGTIKTTRIAAGYQFSETEVKESGTSRSNGLNLNVNSQLTTGLMLTGTARYTSTRTPANVVAPGVNVFQERSAGLTAIYRPPLYWWDGSVGYNYSESPFFEEFKSHLLQGNLNVRPRQRIDANANMRFMRFTVGDTQVTTESLNASINWRPIFGLSTGLGGGWTLTSTSNATDTDTLTQNYRYTINYSRPWRNLQYRVGYNITYGLSSTTPAGPDSHDLSNSVTAGVDNTNTRVIHVGLNTTLTNRKTDSQESDQTSYSVNLTADSSYFRNLIRRGDVLTLRATTNYTDNRGIGLEGRVVRLDTTADYVWFVLSVNTGYTIEDYPNEALLDRQRFFGQIQWFFFRIRNLSLNLSLRDTFEDNRFRDDVNRLEGNTQATYQLGRLTLNLQYQRIVTSVSGVSDSRTVSDVIFARAIRPF